MRYMILDSNDMDYQDFKSDGPSNGQFLPFGVQIIYKENTCPWKLPKQNQ